MTDSPNKTVFTKRVPAGPWTYVLEVKELQDKTRYLAIRQLGDVGALGGGRSRIVILEQHLAAFATALGSARQYLAAAGTSKAHNVQAIRQTYPRAYMRWTANEDERLEREYLRGKTVAELVGILRRQRGGILSRLQKLGLEDRGAVSTLQIHARDLVGNWHAGWALDLHTVSSVALPDGGFDTQRTEIGELLYQLKYSFDRSNIEPIATAAAAFLKGRRFLEPLTAIIPVPPSNLDRPFQPVPQLALRIGEQMQLPVALDYLTKVRRTHPLKDLEDAETRRDQLTGAFTVADHRFVGKRVLLFDDLFRSGETLQEITDLLVKEGRVSTVYVLTITKTRTKR